jgi:hypothetical protein
MTIKIARAADLLQRSKQEREVSLKIIEESERKLEHHYLIDRTWLDLWVSF